jgi:DNA-binding SARP family transcriptional activator
MGLGERLDQREQWEKAAEYYQKALEVDELAEEFYQHLMTCYKSLGQEAKAVTIYRRCKDSLSMALGVEPSLKTQAIYKSLMLPNR